MNRDDSEPAVGVVAIGRNEGERLRRCLESVRKQCACVVYVDSGSQDGSVAMARAMGIEVVELDLAIPFTAARARNEGLKRLLELRGSVEFVQFVDGDCELMPGWIAAALRTMQDHRDVVVVCGRRRERFRDATIYNRLCDMEWNTPIGEADSCGGDALMRIAALELVGGYNQDLICGEEPDLCRRLRAQGKVVLRIDAEMTLHDAAMTRLGQWWARALRTGFGAADSMFRLGGGAPKGQRRWIRGALIWALAFPALIVLGLVVAVVQASATVALWVAGGAVLIVLLQVMRIAARRNSNGESATDVCLYAVNCMAEKLPHALGMIRCWRLRKRGVAPQLIEYK